MSRRTKLLEQLVASEKFGKEKEQEQQFLLATAELILTDLIEIAIKGVEKHGAGTLVLNLINDSSVFMSGNDIEVDLRKAESAEDEEIVTFLRGLMVEIDGNDWSQNVLITLISDAGTRTFAVEAGRSQESLRENAEKLRG